MNATMESPVQSLTSTQATELSLLIDLEARWENLRIYQPRTPGIVSTLKELHHKQKAYEAFFAKLTAYNKRHKPAHVPELLLNNAARLSLWCRRMRDLHRQIQSDPQAQCPLHLLEKAYRWADRLADRVSKPRVARPTPSSGTISGAIVELDDLVAWCDSLSHE